MNYFELLNDSLLHIIFSYIDYENIKTLNKIIKIDIDYILLILIRFLEYNIIYKINKDGSIIKYPFDVEYDKLYKTLIQLSKSELKNLINIMSVPVSIIPIDARSSNNNNVFNDYALDPKILNGRYDLNYINYIYYIKIYKQFKWILKYSFPDNYLMYKFIYTALIDSIKNGSMSEYFITSLFSLDYYEVILLINKLNINIKYMISLIVHKNYIGNDEDLLQEYLVRNLSRDAHDKITHYYDDAINMQMYSYLILDMGILIG